MRGVTFFLFAPAAIVILGGCREPPNPPSQESLDMAWQRTDQAVVSAERARNEARQATRLRDIDRLRYEAERDEIAGQLSVLRGITLAESLLLLAVLPWLAVEVRRRRMWAHLAQQIAAPTGTSKPTVRSVSSKAVEGATTI